MGHQTAPAADAGLTWEDLERASLWLDAQNQTIDSIDLTDIPADASPDDTCILDDDTTADDQCPASEKDPPEMARSSTASELHSSFGSSKSSGSERTHRRLPSTDAALDACDPQLLELLGLAPPAESVVPSPRRRSFTGMRQDTASPDWRSRKGSWFGSSPSQGGTQGSAPASMSGSPAGSKGSGAPPVRKERRRDSLLRWITRKPAKEAQVVQAEAMEKPEFQELPAEEAVMFAW